MKKILATLLTFIIGLVVNAQQISKPSMAEISTLPQWAQQMYGDNPNVYEVQQAYQNYYQNNNFEKNYHTQFYKKWMRSVADYIEQDGTALLPTTQQQIDKRQSLISDGQTRSGGWNLLGPITAFNGNGDVISQQSNIYSIDQSLSNDDVLFCGTEPGEVYKSIDGGENWTNSSLNDPLSGGVNSVKIHPTNPDIVLIGSGSFIYKSIDGGTTWTNVLSNLDRVNEITFAVSNPLIVFAATNNGLFKSIDGGNNWTAMYTDQTFDVKLNTADDNTIYIVKHNAALDICQFLMSIDMGTTFVAQTTGWYASTDAARNDGGARIGVSEADSDVVYAYLIGEAKTDDNGYIGVYKSTDGGVTWSLPNAPAGGPYDAVHQNLAIGEPNWQYHQGFYNSAIMVSPTDANEILVGGLNLYKSTDGGTTFTPLVGYNGGSYNMHVDMQDFRTINGTTWITTDGGIYKSTDFFTTDGFESKMSGVHGAEYWGFGQGWNQDVTVGGLYHNGNLASFDNWGAGNFLQLGGAEPASGYVNPGENRKVYSSDVNGKILPMLIGDPINSVGFGIDPNESYWSVASSELEFQPSNYNTAHTGLGNQLWQTTDGGNTFLPFATFGTNADDKVTYIELSWSNENVMYVGQQIGSGSQGKLWKTTDAGATWNQIALPTVSNSRKMLIQVDAKDDNIVWIAFASAANGQKIYKSINGGGSWTNWSTSLLNNQNARSIIAVGGTDGGVYYASNQTVYYRNNTMSDWEDFGDGLPVETNTNIARPFYRDGKVRTASYGKGIWETNMYELPTEPIAQISADKLGYTMHCEVDTFHYVDHSMLNHNNATWAWEFEGGIPTTANTWNADVAYAEPGTYLTTLTVTNAAGNSDIDSVYVVIDAYVPATFLDEDFEANFLPYGFEIVNEDDGQAWEQNTSVGGFGTSSQCMVMRGFDYWPGGDEDDVRVSLDMSYLQDSWLSFDVAYAQYSSGNSDSLEVLVSTDCGATYTSVYFKGGSDLATAPDNTSYFTPSSAEWRTDSIDLASYEGHEDLLIAFRSHTGWGNNVYVDNINLSANDHSEIKESNDVELNLYPNLISSSDQIHIYSNLNEDIQVVIYSADGKLVYRNMHPPIADITINNLSRGNYIYVLKSSKIIKKGLLIVD
jgi:photosystem II stability/assembly factor-like uncharacterized protein